MKRDALNVALAGCGVVGSGVMKILTEDAARVSASAGRSVCLTHIVDIKPVNAPAGVRVTASIDEALAAADVLVETIGGTKAALAFTEAALKKGISVVTSNKELVATHGEALLRLAQEHGARYRYEAAVGGGIPVLAPIRDDLGANAIARIDGIVNGSTNYLLTRMTDMGVSFPAALGEAKELGYVEANPAADVEGYDARRKLMILAHEAFGAPLGEDARIPTEGIARITPADIARAAACGGAVKLIAHARRLGEYWTGWVHPAFISYHDPLHGVRDVFNAIMLTGDNVGDVMFYGRGAGKLPTASAVVGDVIDIARGDRLAAAPKPDAAPGFAAPDGVTVRALLPNTPEAREAVPDARILNDAGIMTPELPFARVRALAETLGALPLLTRD